MRLVKRKTARSIHGVSEFTPNCLRRRNLYPRAGDRLQANVVGTSGKMFVHALGNLPCIAPCKQRIDKPITQRANLFIGKAEASPTVLIVRV